ncbi:MAG: hypothetical protein KKA05_10985 [Alphaproteobacteria bacterium]|nr:hypothetical protein [Alphaproteobacteria bacterium]
MRKAKNDQTEPSPIEQIILNALERKLKKKDIINVLTNMGIAKSTAYAKVAAVNSSLTAISQPAVV